MLSIFFFRLQIFSFAHTHTENRQYKVHNAFISLEYLVKIVRKLMQQMFECFDDFKKYKKSSHCTFMPLHSNSYSTLDV